MITWEKVSISDVADEVTVGHVGPMASEYVDKGIPFLRSLNIEPFNIKCDGIKFIAPTFHKRLQKSSLRPGDVVIVRTGKPGTCAVIPDWLLEANCSDVVIVRCNERVRPRFLCYVVNSVAGHHISSHIVGAVQQHFNVGSARTLEFLLPSIEGQDAILAILGSLDDKIDLNRRMNETLEAMARALFRDWFVEFSPTRAKMAGEAPYLAPELWELFPDRLDDEGRPEGWKTEPLDETATFLNGLALQKYPATGDISLPAIKIAQLRSENTETADPVSLDIPDDYIVEQNDLLFSWSGSLLCKFWNGQRGALNQHLFKVTSKRFEPWFIYEWIQFYMPEFQAIAAAKATTMGHIQRRHLTESLVTIPPSNIMQAANKAIGSLVEQIQSYNGQSHTLVQLRDLLLPKLMSGEISIRDAEKMVDNAT